MRLYLALFGLSFLLMGCATSSEPIEVEYDEASEQTTYTTDEIRLDGIDVTSGLSKQNRFYVQIEGSCLGEDCIPARYSLSFLKEGTQPIELTSRNVELTVGTETLSWNDPQNRRLTQTSVVRNGSFASVEISQKQLVTIGSVSEVTGSVGDISFQIPHQNRDPIRKLLSQLDLSSTSEDSSSSTSSR